jgi:phosphotriesterase-related protein
MGVPAPGTIETVTGPIREEDVGPALAHEHLLVDFRDAGDPSLDRASVRAECERRLAEVRADGVDLLVDCTAIGIGRDVELLRDVSLSTGIRIVAATGVYKGRRPPELRAATEPMLASLFVRELTEGIGATGIRAGFIKLATTEEGPTEDETAIHRAGAQAAATTGAAIVLHSTRAPVTFSILRTFRAERFDPTRLVWAHAQESTPEQNVELAEHGVTVSFDAVGTSDDGDVLDRIERMADAGHAGQIVLSSDSTLVMQPPEWVYERDLTYLHRTFVPKVAARFGQALADDVAGRTIARLLARVP